MECVGKYVSCKFAEYLLNFSQSVGFNRMCFFEELNHYLSQLSLLVSVDEYIK
jgi:hypothetical protein